jgi:hypothetical protein
MSQKDVSRVRFAGYVLSITLVVSLIYAAWDTIVKVNWLDPSIFLSAALATGLWISGQIAAGWSWWFLLSKTSKPGLVIALLLATQIGKYAPGNVGQFLGRAYLARRYGIPLTKTAVSVAVESTLSIGSGFAIAGASLLIDGGELGPLEAYLPDPRLLGIFLSMAALVMLGALFGPHVALRRTQTDSCWLRYMPPAIAIRFLTPAALLQAGIFVIAALGLWLIAGAVGDANPPVPAVLGIFAIAAVAGFATPGAPGGLGVREAVISAGLSPYLGADHSITVAITFRASTILGDVAIFVMGALTLSGQPSAKSDPPRHL